MKKFFYRFRSAEDLLDKHSELEKQEIYFAHPNELNDPMEGLLNIFWSGDSIVWKNLLKNYLLCLERTCALYTIGGNERHISPESLPVFSSEDDLPTSEYKELFKRIATFFFDNTFVQEYLQKLAVRSTPVRRNELIFHLWTFHIFALSTIFSVYREKNLFRSGLLDTPDIIMKASDFISPTFLELLEAVEQDKSSTPNAIGVLFTATKMIRDQAHLILRQQPSTTDSESRNLLLLDFPDTYLSQLEKIIFPAWYAACFMSDYSSSSSWSHYADKHSGVCLIFKGRPHNKISSLELLRINSWSRNGPRCGYVKHRFQKVNYTSKHVEIDFFRSLGRIPLGKLKSFWYTDVDGTVSKCAVDILKSEDEWRDRYWKHFTDAIVIKSLDWRNEKEYRLILTSLLDDFESKSSRLAKYNFSDLEGLIFGINTTTQNKLRIIDIIQKKCAAEGRKDFKFYQAIYDADKSRISRLEMNLIKPTYIP